MRNDTICWLPARVLGRRIARRELSASDALEAQLARIDELNPKLNALVSLDVAAARRAAQAADGALLRGEAVGPLHGVPLTLKDGHDVQGLRTTVGTPLFDRVASEDGSVAARLRAAGAILIGHSNVPPFLSDYQTDNPIFGRTQNPWDLARTPGGSSGGAAAALAAGLTPLEVGSDLAGSLRLPAHFCGVYGLKPSEHRVPLTGFFRPPPGVPRSVRILSCLGPLARDLDDLELALRIIAGPAPSAGGLDAAGIDSDVAPVPLTVEPPRQLRGLRLAVLMGVPGTRVARPIRAVVERIAGDAERLGVELEQRLPEVDWQEQEQLFGALLSSLTGLFDPNAQLDAERRTLAWYFGALERRERWIHAWQAYFQDIDALLLPAAMTSAFRHTEPFGRIDVDGEAVPYAEHGRHLAFANLIGLPALSAPAGRSADSLPIGVQIVGPLWSELRLIQIARLLEQAQILPGFQPPPGC